MILTCDCQLGLAASSSGDEGRGTRYSDGLPAIEELLDKEYYTLTTNKVNAGAVDKNRGRRPRRSAPKIGGKRHGYLRPDLCVHCLPIRPLIIQWVKELNLNPQNYQWHDSLIKRPNTNNINLL